MEYYSRKVECDTKCNASELTRDVRQSQGTRMGIFIRVRHRFAQVYDELPVREKWITVDGTCSLRG